MRFRWSSAIVVLACILQTSLQAGIGAAESGESRYYPDDLSGEDRFYQDESPTGNEPSDTDESDSYDDDSDAVVAVNLKSEFEDQLLEPLEESKRNLLFAASQVARSVTGWVQPELDFFSPSQARILLSQEIIN